MGKNSPPSINHLPSTLNSPAWLHGATAFSTIRTRKGTPLLWPAHLERLAGTARLLGLPDPLNTPQPKLEPLPWGLLRLTLSAEGLHFSHRPLTLGPKPAGGVVVALTDWQVHPQLGAHKTGNYLPYRLAGAEAEAAGAFEGLLRLGQCLCDGSRTAPLLRLGDEWVAPAGGLPSITRAHFARVALGGEVVTRPVPLGELESVQAMYLCGSGVGIVPVRQLWLEGERQLDLPAEWPDTRDAALVWPE